MVVKAFCFSTGTEVRFSLTKKYLKELNETWLNETWLSWFTTREEFRRFLRKKDGLIFTASESVKQGFEEMEDTSREKDVEFNKNGSFRVGCMQFDRKNAAKIRKWAGK